MEAPLGSTDKSHDPIGFTLSPKPQKVNANRELFEVWVKRIHPILKTFSKTYTYYHEFDKTGRLHFHGWLEPYDIIKFKKCCNSLRQLGFVKYEMKYRNGFNAWKEYCSKHIEETSQIYGEFAVHWNPCTPETIKLIKRYHKLKEEQDKHYGWFQTKLISEA